ncbi:MAG: hypothetical protein SFU91_14910 [Chloroherpetonaceae bacterium]|nr:hypothetical protein [Chloroherpetonaceae bacterium]
MLADSFPFQKPTNAKPKTVQLNSASLRLAEWGAAPPLFARFASLNIRFA